MVVNKHEKQFVPLYKRQDSLARGRHLVANRSIEEGEIVFNERPLLSLQTIGNAHDGALVCRRCKCFLFCRKTQLKLCAGQMARSDVNGDKSDHIVSCRAKCGELYCSKQCEESAWECHGHCFLCTGSIPENISEQEQHPLIKFKLHAIQTNEIFLMVADWIVRIICLRARDIRSYSSSNLNEVLEPFFDFTMTPWWDVITAMENLQATSLDRRDQIHSDSYDDNEDSSSSDCNGDIESESDNIPLTVTLKNLCDESSTLFKEVLVQFFNDNRKVADNKIDFLYNAFEECADNGLLSRDMFAKVIGSFEQNAVGIRTRHPLCTDILFGDLDSSSDVYDAGKLFRFNNGALILSCLEHAKNVDNNDFIKKSCSQQENLISEIENRLNQMEIDISDEFGNSVESLDDLDGCFTPLDGTAMFPLACKMNHSCSPNVLVRYRCGFGQNRPLVLQCIALRHIQVDEELCISYIQCDAPFYDRQQDLGNYGFRCTCPKCISEEANDQTFVDKSKAKVEELSNGLFGSESENESDTDEEEISNVDRNQLSGTEILKNTIKSNFDHNPKYGAIPISKVASGLQFLLKEGSLICKKLEQYEKDAIISDDIRILQRTMKRCLVAAQIRQFRTCGMYGRHGVKESFSILSKYGSWPNSTYTEAYGCFAVASCIGSANEGHFCDASHTLDKAVILSPLCRHDIPEFFDYVFEYSRNMFDNECYLTFSSTEELTSQSLAGKALSQLLSCCAEEIIYEDINLDKLNSYIDASKPLVIRSLANQWKAFSKWNDLNFFATKYGHKIVPIEIGTMHGGKMREVFMSILDFTVQYLLPSNSKMWSLAYSVDHSNSVAYMAQFRLFDLIPELLSDIEDILPILGDSSVQIHGWLGTGGTRTPLHYDSYDNILVQIVGSKYIRLYGSDQTNSLYVVTQKSATDSVLRQGNFSAIDCEQEDLEKHPKVSQARYVELVLNPGDALFIPAGCWHYVRSLATSFSVNYFWTS